MKTELVTSLKRQATRILADLHETKEPVLITEHGQPSAYLLDVHDYEQLMTRMSIWLWKTTSSRWKEKRKGVTVTASTEHTKDDRE